MESSVKKAMLERKCKEKTRTPNVSIEVEDENSNQQILTVLFFFCILGTNFIKLHIVHSHKSPKNSNHNTKSWFPVVEAAEQLDNKSTKNS